ncbi:TetR/AcrR family transcriptional regulator [Paraclostridium bifermentans]|uniref:TetR/AcrR family transcriptional regulator n=1 Tax=Paraclostridium bifermentans TaxID=1490 RepID=A0ABY8R2L0_PARBF|nr:TetR/AcrR family transcriptional regulator [Paraclostridium bifermentans]
MNKTFENLSEEKRLRIINSAIEEFANKGYRRATVDNIVLKAGISKGSIFQYFQNKERLYIYICNYQIDIIKDEALKQKKIMKMIFLKYTNRLHILSLKYLRKIHIFLNSFKHCTQMIHK